MPRRLPRASPAQHSSSPRDAAACQHLSVPQCQLHTHSHGAGAASFTEGHWSDAEVQHTDKRGFTHSHLAYKNLRGLRSPQQVPLLILHSCMWGAGSAACSDKQQRRSRQGSQKGRAAGAPTGRARSHVMAIEQSSHP